MSAEAKSEIAIKSPFDLSIFCDPESSRFSIQTPFVKQGQLCATDGRILVCVTVPPGTLESEGRTPNVLPLIEPVGFVKEWHPLPDVNSTCIRCDQKGNHERPCDCMHGICTCKCGCSHECEACEDGVIKSRCDCWVKFGNRFIATWMAQKIAVIPGVMWGVTPKDAEVIDGPIYLKFEGGCGAAMPLMDMEQSHV
jgi:hypothetical protein